MIERQPPEAGVFVVIFRLIQRWQAFRSGELNGEARHTGYTYMAIDNGR